MQPKTILKIFVVSGITLLLFIFGHYQGFTGGIENGLRALISPLINKTYSFNVAVGDRYEFFQSTQEFLDSYRQCLAQSDLAAADQAKLALLEKENQELKKLLAFTAHSTSTIVTVPVIGVTLEGVDKTILISVPPAALITVGQPVISASGLLVGRLTHIQGNAGVVTLLTDRQSKILGTIINEDQSLGVVEGGFGLSLKMKFIPRNEKLAVGNQVVTSGLEPHIPRGLIIGKIAAIENEPYKPFQQAVLSPAANLNKLLIVGVLTTH